MFYIRYRLAYISLQRKNTCVGPWRWAITPNTRVLHWDTNMLGYQHVRFVLPPTRTLKFALPPTQTPNPNRWNIGRIGSPTQNSHGGHVDFMCLCSFHSRWLPNRNPVCSGIWALTFPDIENDHIMPRWTKMLVIQNKITEYL